MCRLHMEGALPAHWGANSRKKGSSGHQTAIEKILESNLQLGLSAQDWARKLVGFGSDGASGSKAENSWAALLLRAIQPCVPAVYRLAHHLDLSYEAEFQSISRVQRGQRPPPQHLSLLSSSPLRRSSPVTAFRGLHLHPVMPPRMEAGMAADLPKGHPATVSE